jgi:diguanylate cyclase (GGDEF)-like protein
VLAQLLQSLIEHSRQVARFEIVQSERLLMWLADELLMPANEGQRLRALHAHGVLDSPAEVDFDALTRVASQAIGAPVATIGLMDLDRLWFKSRLGLDEPQLDRHVAFCSLAIMHPDELLVVENLSKDMRFRNNPLVTNAPSLRFYAGAPIVDPNGFALGTIAVMDTRARTLADKEASLLRDLSTLAMSTLENRRRALMLGSLALTDHLTGLPNRVQFDRALISEIAHARRTGSPFMLLYMDLDGFTAINDQFGHAAGDEVLCEVARRLQRGVRSEDTVARLGNDEFGVIMRNASADAARLLENRIAETVSVPITLSRGYLANVGISIGFASYADTEEPEANLLARAAAALDSAKHLQSGR